MPFFKKFGALFLIAVIIMNIAGCGASGKRSDAKMKRIIALCALAAVMLSGCGDTSRIDKLAQSSISRAETVTTAPPAAVQQTETTSAAEAVHENDTQELIDLTVLDRFKAAGKVGIPFLVFEDGTMIHDWEGWCRENGIPPGSAATGQACSIDGKGC